jgi:hypothetical protein
MTGTGEPRFFEIEFVYPPPGGESERIPVNGMPDRTTSTAMARAAVLAIRDVARWRKDVAAHPEHVHIRLRDIITDEVRTFRGVPTREDGVFGVTPTVAPGDTPVD